MLAGTRLWTPYGATFETPTGSGIVPVRACCDGRKVLTATLPLAGIGNLQRAVLAAADQPGSGDPLLISAPCRTSAADR